MNQSDWDTLPKKYPITNSGIYLRNASMSAIHESVIVAMNKATNSMGQYGLSDEAAYKVRYREIHCNVANFLNVPLDTIALTSSTSYNMNIFAMMMKSKEKQNIITHSDEFPSSILPFRHHGFAVKELKNVNGVFDPLELLKLIDNETSTVVLSSVVSTTGFRPQLQELSEQLNNRGIALILNATQSIGFFDLNLAKLKVAALSASSHKSVGSVVGMAIAYMSDSFRELAKTPLIGWASVENPSDLSIAKQIPRGDAATIELASMPFSLMAALNCALEVHKLIPIEEKSQRILALTKLLRAGLKELGIRVLGSNNSEQQSSITTFSLANALQVKSELESQKIFINIKRGHLRASLGLHNSEQEIVTFLEALKSVLKA